MAHNTKGFRVLNRLLDNGYTTEKAVLNMTIDDMLRLPGVNMVELEQLVALQKSIKQNKVIHFLAGEDKSIPPQTVDSHETAACTAHEESRERDGG